MLNVKNESGNAEDRVLTMEELESMETSELLELLTLSGIDGNNNTSIIIREIVRQAAAGTSDRLRKTHGKRKRHHKRKHKANKRTA